VTFRDSSTDKATQALKKLVGQISHTINDGTFATFRRVFADSMGDFYADNIKHNVPLMLA
jgi:hypothetical protein